MKCDTLRNDIQHNIRWNATLSLALCIMAFSIMKLSRVTFRIITISIMTLSKMTSSRMTLNTDCYFRLCHACWVLIMLNVANKPIMLCIIILHVNMISVIMLSIMELGKAWVSLVSPRLSLLAVSSNVLNKPNLSDLHQKPLPIKCPTKLSSFSVT